MLKCGTANDDVLTKVIKQAQKGFPHSRHQVHKDVQPYHNYRHQLAITKGVLLYKNRVVIPTELRQQVLQTLHAAHQGVTGKYRPRQEWGFIQEDRDRALSRRLQVDGSRLERNTRQLKEWSLRINPSTRLLSE